MWAMEFRQSRRTKMLMNVKFFSLLIDLIIGMFTAKISAAEITTYVCMADDIVSTLTLRISMSSIIVKFLARPSMFK